MASGPARVRQVALGRRLHNSFIERYNRFLRCGVGGMRVVRALMEVRGCAERFLVDYNCEIPHDSLGGITPAGLSQENDFSAADLDWH